MKIAYSHIVRHIKSNPDLTEVSEKLFQLGHEHEILNESIFDIEITPNRGDCLSVNGILRDLKLFYEIDLDHEIYDKQLKNFDFNFINNAKQHCKNISFLKIDIKDIPKNYNTYINDYFLDLGISKKNFFTDVSNYISYETGQPTHCYKFDQIDNFIKLDIIKEDAEFFTLLDKKIKLTGENLVFLNRNNEVINLAGIMGGKKSACDHRTKSVIVECAYFDPEMILGKAVRFNLNSDAAHKFERNTDPFCHNYVLRRFLKIVEEHTEIINVEVFTDNSIDEDEFINKISFDTNKANQILGTNINKNDCIQYLTKLGFKYIDNSFIAPSYRHDVKTLNDLSEELARSIGYDQIKDKNFTINFYEQKQIVDDEQALKEVLIKNGFYEVINDPFVSFNEGFGISVDNPLDSKRKYLRTDLKSSLIQNLIYNERRQQDSIKFFEFSDLYSTKEIVKKRVLAIIASGRIDKNFRDFSKKITNEYVTNILSDYISDSDLNFIPISRESMNSKSKNHISYVEIEVISNGLSKHEPKDHKIEKDIHNYKYNPVSDFPKSHRDLSFAVKDFSSLTKLEETLLNFDNELLKDVFVFDYYNNTSKEEIKIGFRFTFQSDSETITDEDVELAMNQIIKLSLDFNGVQIPGMRTY